MTTCDFPGDLTHVDYAAFLSQHDVVYQSPVADGIDGLPVGNGDLGAMIWTPPDRLHLAINKVDLFDDGPDGPFSSWGDDVEESNTTQRAAGTLAISNGLPAYDRLYLTDFEGRLRLAEAEVDIRSVTPFARAKTEILASEDAGVLVVHYEDETEEALPRRIELARWGSRSFPHWYNKVKREITRPLQGTDCGSDGRHVWITQQLRALHFAVVALVDGPAAPRRLHSRAGVFESPPVTSFAATVYLAVVNSEEAGDPLATAIQRVDAAAQMGRQPLVAAHRQSWQRFWQTSFVDLPPEQDYLENLWYLNSYQVASASKGRYPLNHIDAIYSWNRDVRPWAHYYHWNDQIHIWPLHAIGHGELAMPYYRYRRSMLEHAMEDAQRVHGVDGAFYTDVANRKGYQAASEGILCRNLTPGPQIAADFWRHWQYTRDLDFLKEHAYPVIREVARFYAAFVQKSEDGRYTFVMTQPYEGVLWLRDTLTDLAHARQIFHIFLEASAILDADHDLAQRCREVMDNLADYVTVQVSAEYSVPCPPDGKADWPDSHPVQFKDVRPGDPTMPIWFLGYKVHSEASAHGQEVPDGTPIHEGMRNPVTHLWIFTSTNMAPIFPANQVGLDQASTPAFQAALNTVRAFGYEGASFSLYLVGKARLGMATELQDALGQFAQRFQVFPNGFFHYFPRGNAQFADGNPRQPRQVRVAGTQGENIWWPVAQSNHMSIEGGPMLQLAINEMLLQSYSGTIRVFPAVPPAWEGQFRLHAVGRFVVSAARMGGETTYVVLESMGGEACRMANPWPGRTITLYGQERAWRPVAELSGDMLAFPTAAGALYLLLPAGKTPAYLNTVNSSGQPNQQAKTLGIARLGLPKGF